MACAAGFKCAGGTDCAPGVVGSDVADWANGALCKTKLSAKPKTKNLALMLIESLQPIE
jgi:hypothetical protein